MKKYFVISLAVLFLVCGCGSKNEALFKQAVRLNAAGDISGALKTYNAILRNDGKYLPALINRAIIYEQMREYKMAEEDYKKAYEINPRHLELLNNMGSFNISQGRPLSAIYYLNQALDIKPNYFTALLNRSAAYNAIDKIESAAQDINDAVAISPSSSAALEQRALINLRRLYVIEAVEDLTKALNSGPYNAKNYYRRGIAFKQARKYANAMADFDTAIRLKPDYVDALYARAQLHFKNVDHYSALADVNTIKSINNEFVPAYELAGDINAIEDPVQAVANYLAARKLNPNNARRYNAKIALMRTEEGRRRVITRTFME
ncbi:MAG: tetratricopeptide repeat protein [Elusimicrobiota bacterium]|jgi:tetratricopeptide (TPR) repeat protein|nr:tetratricopeptide repeat protein [Elusimicrobiota bacterium]